MSQRKALQKLARQYSERFGAVCYVAEGSNEGICRNSRGDIILHFAVVPSRRLKKLLKEGPITRNVLLNIPENTTNDH